MEHIQTLDIGALRSAIRKEYREVACRPEKGFHFLSGKALTKVLGYTADTLMNIPEGAIESFAGVGNPFLMGLPLIGQTIVDIGCGAGLDAIIAARMVELEGMVVGIDMTRAMIEKARDNAWKAFAINTRFIQAFAEVLPLPDGFADIVMSNGVINLCADKEQVFSEIFRVLRPGGRLQIADVLLQRPVPEGAKDRVHLWTSCVAGGLLINEYIDIVRNAGFSNVCVMEAFDVFRDAPVASSAANFDAKGYNVYAEKPVWGAGGREQKAESMDMLDTFQA